MRILAPNTETATMPDTDLPQHHYETRRIELFAGTSVDMLIVFGYGSVLGAGTKSHGVMRYLTGWDSHEATSLLIITQTSTMLLVGSPFMVPSAQAKLQDIDIVDIPTANWGVYLKDHVHGSLGSIGFDEMPMAIYRGLEANIDTRAIRTFDQNLAEMQLFKDEETIDLHKLGATICDMLFASLGDEIHQGKTSSEIQITLEATARLLGADYCKTWLTVMPCADYPRYWPEEGARIPQAGDQVLFGIALTVAGNWAHGIRMGSIGPATPAQTKLWQSAADMLQAGIESLKPDNSLRTCGDEMNRVLAEHYTHDEVSQMVRFRAGHGLGTTYEDTLITANFPQYFGNAAPSSLKVTSDLTVQPGMLLELHPGFFLPDVGGAAIGEMILMTDTGPECLITHPTDYMKL